MRTIETNVYKFEELSDEAKQKAIEWYRQGNYEDFPFQSEVNAAFEKFADIFNVSNYEIDYLQPYRNEYKLNFDDDVLNLSGIRLLKYLWNNYGNYLFKGEYYSLWSKTDFPYNEYHKKPFPKLKTRRSKVLKDDSCVLTGVCYDNSILQPIYDFLKKPSDITFEELIGECISSLCSDVGKELEWRNEDEQIIEEIIVNEYEFDKDGELA